MAQHLQDSNHFDVLILGAGLSGIDAAHHLRKYSPSKSYVILEQRDRIGGTWDLFRYPGIRSDSDMLTMGYSFKPWTNTKAISPGEDIRAYIEETAREEGIDQHIRFRHRVVHARWSTETSTWTIEAIRTVSGGTEEPVTITANFLFSCAGYYRYSSGYLPDFPGIADYQGTVVHPQKWPENLDYSGKKVVIIGSGATAVTLVPAMAETAAHVTMLQRSPTFIVSAPSEDPVATFLRRILPDTWAFRLSRWKNIGFQWYFYQLAQLFPNYATKKILEPVEKELGPELTKQFTPSYRPWEQRICLIPDSDMFNAIKSGKASVVTGHIDTFNAKGIRLQSGAELEADVIVTATGLVMQAFGGIDLEVDGKTVDISQTLAYKGVLFSGIPNLAVVFGYINASWTLKADLVCRYVCRLLNRMDEKGATKVVPNRGSEQAVAPFVERFSSGYMQRTLAQWPKQGAGKPWKVYQNYFRDVFQLRWETVDNPALEFSTSPGAVSNKPAAGQRPAEFAAAGK